MRVLVPTQLRSYTAKRAEVDASGTTLRALLADLNSHFPGMAFRMVDEQDRIREHLRFFVNGELVRTLDHPLAATDEVQIICAISGG